MKGPGMHCGTFMLQVYQSSLKMLAVYGWFFDQIFNQKLILIKVLGLNPISKKEKEKIDWKQLCSRLLHLHY